jgi:hypothetical protein
MKPIFHSLLALAVALTAVPAGFAQAFDSGSNGSYGPINVTTTDVTLDLPPDGVFHATTVTVNAGRILRFNRNALNTPVFVLATGDVTIAGEIDVSGSAGSNTAAGRGGPGGFDGGTPGSAGTPPGDGHGPGAGGGGANGQETDGAGHGAYANPISGLGQSTRHGSPYGSALLVPIMGGSGGGGAAGTPGHGGGGGGGAILIASNTRIHLTGRITANGGSWSGNSFNGGSGGAVRLVAPVVSGTGVLLVLGSQGFGGNGHGRIRVDTLNRAQMEFNFLPNSSVAIGSLMLVQPSPLPQLDLVEVAGRAVEVGSGPVQVVLPFGAPAQQLIKVRARDFNQSVPLRLVLTPESGAARSYDFEVNNATANPAEASVTVEFPVNTATHVAVWTR